jgi:hypothetical protein
MRPEIYWIDVQAGARLAIMPRTRAGDRLGDEIAGWRGQGIDVIVSVLEAGEVRELDLQREAGLCHDSGMEFISFPIGRSSLMAACVLVLMGMAPGTAFGLIGKARGLKVPDTEGQRDWVERFRDAAATSGTVGPEARQGCQQSRR